MKNFLLFSFIIFISSCTNQLEEHQKDLVRIAEEVNEKEFD